MSKINYTTDFRFNGQAISMHGMSQPLDPILGRLRVTSGGTGDLVSVPWESRGMYTLKSKVE